MFAGYFEACLQPPTGTAFEVELDVPGAPLYSATSGRAYVSSVRPCPKSNGYQVRLLRTPPANADRLAGLVADVQRHPFVQRLGQVTQLGSIASIFPLFTPAYDRLTHSLGVSRLAKALGTRLERLTSHLPNGDPRCVTAYDSFALELAGMLHDVGHGPLSHQFDEYIDRFVLQQRVEQKSARSPLAPYPKHEERGMRMVMFILEDCFASSAQWQRAFPRGVEELHAHVCALIAGKPHPSLPPSIRNAINADSAVTIDVDRLDYLPRDAAALIPGTGDWVPVAQCALDRAKLSDDCRDLIFDPESTQNLMELRTYMYTVYYCKTAMHRAAFDRAMLLLLECTPGASLECLYMRTRADARDFCTFFEERKLLKSFKP